MMDTPLAFSMRMVANSVSISRLVRGAVGSSMIRMRDWMDRALATSTICLWATPRLRMRERALISMPSSSSKSCAFLVMACQLTMAGLRMMGSPMKIFSATVSCSMRFSSW